jgi:hypothetical protein
MNLVAQKLDPDKDFRWIYFSDSGLDLYSNGIMVSAKLAREKPDAAKGLVRAIARATREAVADPGAAIELLAVKEPLINKDIEKRRLVYVVKTLIATSEAAELGVGDTKAIRAWPRRSRRLSPPMSCRKRRRSGRYSTDRFCRPRAIECFPPRATETCPSRGSTAFPPLRPTT